MADENVIVARARITGAIALEAEAPTHIKVKAGTRIQLKFPYRFDDLADRRENYEISLAVALDDEPEVVEAVEARDHPGLSDDRRGFIMQERVIIAAGEHVIHFRASVRLEVGGWDGGDTQLQERVVEGTVLVTVR